MSDVIENKTILVVDDAPENVDVLVGILGPFYKIKVATSGQKALKIALLTPQPDLILLDIMMPDIDGYQVCQFLKTDPKTSKIPIIFVTAKDETIDEARGLDLGAVDYITKPVSPSIVKARVHNHLELKLYRDQLEELVKKRTLELRLTQEVTIESLGALAEYRDPETGGHIKRTQNYVNILGRYLWDHSKYKTALHPEAIDWLYISAPLHDIGKVAVPDSILLKPAALTPSEFEEMKRHTIYGRDVIQKSVDKLGFNSFLQVAMEIAYTHHEKFDGSGYPQGLKGEDIPLSGRIMALADIYDALIGKRVYKPPLSHKKAVDIILNGNPPRTIPQHFDPEVLDAFNILQDKFLEIALEFADDEVNREILNADS